MPKAQETLFYVKIQLFMDKMGEMMSRSAAGEVPNPSKYSTIWCSTEKPGLGYTIFRVESREQLDDVLEKLKPYSKVHEIAPIITLAEFQAKMSPKEG
jgi:hypothetical protein